MLKLEELPETIRLHSYAEDGGYYVVSVRVVIWSRERWSRHVLAGDVPEHKRFIYIPKPDTGDWACVVHKDGTPSIKFYPNLDTAIAAVRLKERV